MLRFQDAPRTDYENRQRLELREYARFYVELTKKKANLKKRFRRNLHLVFPGYDSVFKNVFTKTSKEILSQSPTPDNIIKMGEAKFLELMKKTSNNHINPDKAGELIAKAEDTIIWAEIGDIENLKHPDQIVTFAGLDPKVKKSGNKEVIGGPSKRGSSTLRWALGWAVQESKMLILFWLHTLKRRLLKANITTRQDVQLLRNL